MPEVFSSTLAWRRRLGFGDLPAALDGNSDLPGLGFKRNSIWFHQRIFLQTKYTKDSHGSFAVATLDLLEQNI